MLKDTGGFSPEDEALSKLRDAVEGQDREAFFASWDDISIESQREIARDLYAVDNDVFGHSLAEGLAERYSGSSTEGRQIIVTGLKDLGSRCESTEDETTDFLMNQLGDREDQNRVDIADALKAKATRASLPLLTGESLSEEQEMRVTKVVNGFLAMLQNPDEQREVKLIVLNDLFRFAKVESLKEPVESELKRLLGDNDQEIADLALDELIEISDPEDPLVLEKLTQRIENFDLANMAYEQKIKLARQLGLVGGANQSRFLEDILAGGDDEDGMISAEVESAQRKINERLRSET